MDPCHKCLKIPQILNYFEGHWYCTDCHSRLSQVRDYEYYKKLKESWAE